MDVRQDEAGFPRVKKRHTAFNDPMHGYTYCIQPRSETRIKQLNGRNAPSQTRMVVLTQKELASIKEAALQQTSDKISTMESLDAKETTNKLLKKRDKIYTEFRRTEDQLLTKDLSKYTRQEANPLEEQIQIQKIKDFEEAKEFNRLVLEVKCRAVRNAQILEKEEIKRQEAEENARYVETMKRDLEKGLASDREKELLRIEATQLAAKQLTNQIEEARQFREQSLTCRKEMEYAKSHRRDQLYREELLKAEEERLKAMLERRQEAEIMKEKIRKKQESLRVEDKLENMKVLKEQMAKQEEEDRRREQENAIRRRKENEKNLRLVMRERQLGEEQQRKELIEKRAIEEDERAWRAKMLQEAQTKSKKQEEEREERRIQLRQEEKRKLEARVKEREENEREKYHSIVSQEREERDLKRKINSTSEAKYRLQEQISLRKERKTKEALLEDAEWSQFKERKRQEEMTFLAMKKNTLQELRDMELSPLLLQDLERRTERLKHI